MNKWLRKSFVVVVSLLTFGLVTPPTQPNLIDRINSDGASERDLFDSKTAFGNQGLAHLPDQKPIPSHEQFIEEMVRLAEVRSYEKFGTKIRPVIENEFREVILPNIEKAIAETALKLPKEDLAQLSISEQPGSGLSEKIFHIKRSVDGRDVIRFHVRRENPPQSGYWFNFHYHTLNDDFQAHHDLGAIYWDKNTPPKWMA